MYKLIRLLPLLMLLLASCHEEPASRVPFGVNDNLIVTSDSLVLQYQRPTHNLSVTASADSVVVFRKDALVIAQVTLIPEDESDSIWVKVARDQQTMGWLRHKELIRSAVPDDPISKFIFTFSDCHFWYFLCVAAVVILLTAYRWARHESFPCVILHDIPSFYPTMLLLTLCTSASLYASIQRFVPDIWLQYYFHPTLNPFALTPVLGLFVASVWLLLVLLIATIDEVFSLLPPMQSLSYLFSLMGICLACYLIFSVAGTYMFGYFLLPVSYVFATWRYAVMFSPHYVCGRCGAKMHDKGKCPLCGAETE